jgi:hypothetical protein
MEFLGRGCNVLANADDVYVPLHNCGGVLFIGFLAAGDTWTLTEQKADGSGDQVLATITRFYTQATPGAAWVKSTQAAGSAVTTTASQDVVAIEVSATELSAGYSQVKLASTSTGTVTAIQYDLHVMRDPANLAALV